MGQHQSTAAKRPSKISIPERCHPLAKVVFAEMKRQNVTYDELEHRSGVLRSTFKAWRTNNLPGLETVEAALGALGWSLLPVPKEGHLPAKLRSQLQAVAEKHTLDLPCLKLIAAVASRPLYLGGARAGQERAAV